MSDESCFVCGESNSVVLQRHHIVPRRYAGSDGDENLVTLCANCHVALERIYTDEVFTKLGRAWEEQQPDVGISDILGILRSSDPPDLSAGNNTEIAHTPFNFGSALAAAYHAVGEDALKETLVALWNEGREDSEDGSAQKMPPDLEFGSEQEAPVGLPDGFD